MKVIINGKEHSFDQNNINLVELLQKIEVSPVGVIVELDGEVLNLNNYSSVTVNDGSNIELMRIVGGG